MRLEAGGGLLGPVGFVEAGTVGTGRESQRVSAERSNASGLGAGISPTKPSRMKEMSIPRGVVGRRNRLRRQGMRGENPRKSPAGGPAMIRAGARVLR